MKVRLLIFAFAGVLFGQSPVRMSPFEAARHELSVSFIRVPKPEMPAVMLEVLVSKRGQVVNATVLGGRADDVDAAEKVIRASQYKPFMQDGQAVDAIVEAWVFVLPLEQLPTEHKSFPRVIDWSTVRFRLTRSGCFGSCPSYEVEIQGDGTVTYTGLRDVAVIGIHKGSIARPALEALLTRFRDADFFSFDPKYALNASDGATYTTSSMIEGQEHSVADYMGSEAGMPIVISHLEQAVDEYAGVDRWVRGNRETIPALRLEGFDFKSQEAGRVLAHVARRGDADAVRDLINSGAPLDVPDPGMFLQEMPLRAAVSNRDVEVMRLLIEAGASKNHAKTKNEAAELARRIDRQDVLAMLLKYGARLGAK